MAPVLLTAMKTPAPKAIELMLPETASHVALTQLEPVRLDETQNVLAVVPATPAATNTEPQATALMTLADVKTGAQLVPLVLRTRPVPLPAMNVELLSVATPDMVVVNGVDDEVCVTTVQVLPSVLVAIALLDGKPPLPTRTHRPLVVAYAD